MGKTWKSQGILPTKMESIFQEYYSVVCMHENRQNLQKKSPKFEKKSPKMAKNRKNLQKSLKFANKIDKICKKNRQKIAKKIAKKC